jgi:hypothetical protein
MMNRYYALLPLSLLSYLSLVTPVVWAAKEPLAVKWSPNVYGPDGPWPAVEVVVGDDQRIALYPGHEWTSILLTSDYCKSNASLPCHAATAGLYNQYQATAQQTGSDGGVQFSQTPDYCMFSFLSPSFATRTIG